MNKSIREQAIDVLNCSGWDNGDPFASEEQLRDYFTVDNFRKVYGRCDETQEVLDRAADIAIERGDCCAF